MFAFRIKVLVLAVAVLTSAGCFRSRDCCRRPDVSASPACCGDAAPLIPAPAPIAPAAPPIPPPAQSFSVAPSCTVSAH